MTGADGFIGQALCARLADEGMRVRRIVRTPSQHAKADVRSGETGSTFSDGHTARDVRAASEAFALGDLATVSDTQLAAALDGAHAVVHLPGRAHVMRDTASDPAAAFRAANVVATERVAMAAVRAGVHRMILASTVKVHGEQSTRGHPVGATDPLNAKDLYARSKIAAEHAFLATCAGTALTPMIIRLPLVYGPRVKGNFLALMDAVARRWSLPFGAIHNRRHLLYVGNLVHALCALIDSAQTAQRTWIAADTDAVSTPDLARRIAVALGVAPRILSVPTPLLKMAAIATGRASMIPRLIASFEVDPLPLTQQVGPPPFSIEQGLAATAAWWRSRHAI